MFRKIQNPLSRPGGAPLGTLFLLVAIVGSSLIGDISTRSASFHFDVPLAIAGGKLPDPDSALCVSDADTTAPLTGTAKNPDTLKVYLVYVGFVDSTEISGPDSCGYFTMADDLPSWFRRFETDLEDYIAWQSYGKDYVDAVTVQRPADSLKAWNLGHTVCYWRRAKPCNSPADTIICPVDAQETSEGCVNRLVVDMIADSLGADYFSDADRLCFIHLGCSFACSTYAGYGDRIGYTCEDCAYSGPGTIQRPITGDTGGDEISTKWLFAHEFGHSIGLGHTPRTSNNPQATNVVYMGRYDAMQNGAPTPIRSSIWGHWFPPYHVWQLTSMTHPDPGVDWFSDTHFDVVNQNSLDVRVYDVRDVDDHNIVRVDIPNSSYYCEFWLVHHQESGSDSLFGDLLAVWHMRYPQYNIPSTRDFDLEVATGKYTECGGSTPDAVAGKDDLECAYVDPRYMGSDLDLFAAGDSLDSNTNPSTQDYENTAYPGSQNVVTGIKISDIRLDYPSPFSGSPSPYEDSNPPKDYWVDITYQKGDTSPFLYLWNGRYFVRSVNVLAGYGYTGEPQGDHESGDDYLILRGPLVHEGGRYVFKIREDGRATDYIDQIQLRVVDHDKDVSIIATHAGAVVGYTSSAPPDEVGGSPGSIPVSLGEHGNPEHFAPGTVVTLAWSGLLPAVGEGGLILTTVGQERSNMPSGGGIAVEVADGQGGWRTVGRVRPRSALTEVYFSDEELGRTGSECVIRLTWLDYHALDQAGFVTLAPPNAWSTVIATPDSAEIAYQGDVVTQLASRDGEFAVLQPENKLTIAIPYTPPAVQRSRTVVVGTYGYYVTPAERLQQEPTSRETLFSYVDHNSPNPFNPLTHIRFGLATGSEVSVKVYGVSGRVVRVLHDGPLSRGDHDFVWNGTDDDGHPIASGVYFYELHAGSEIRTGKMLAVK
jgi:hypothetical protein